MPDLQLLAVLGSLGAAIAAAYATFQTRKSMEASSFFYLHQHLSRDEYSHARRVVRERLAPRKPDGGLVRPVIEWNEDELEAANLVCASYDQAGLLLEAKVVGRSSKAFFLQSSWGESICHQHEALSEYLDQERAPGITGREFFAHFERLNRDACLIHRNQPSPK